MNSLNYLCEDISKHARVCSTLSRHVLTYPDMPAAVPSCPDVSEPPYWGLSKPFRTCLGMFNPVRICPVCSNVLSITIVNQVASIIFLLEWIQPSTNCITSFFLPKSIKRRSSIKTRLLLLSYSKPHHQYCCCLCWRFDETNVCSFIPMLQWFVTSSAPIKLLSSLYLAVFLLATCLYSRLV